MQVYYDKDADLSIIKSKKVAIVGSGPAGLSAAQRRRRQKCRTIATPTAHKQLPAAPDWGMIGVHCRFTALSWCGNAFHPCLCPGGVAPDRCPQPLQDAVLPCLNM